MLGCSSCGAPQRDGAAFCDTCGSPLTPARARGEAEAKQVTVMFVDIVGSMDLSERLGADAWTSIIERFFVLAAGDVEAFGGTVDKFTGDGLMAIFGAPIGQEDHAQRACLSALRLHESLREFAREFATQDVRFAVRIGLNSGEVVVGEIGEGGSMSYTAIGHTVGLAARMEAIAPPGRTAVSASTEALTRDQFEFEELHGGAPIKGTLGPQRVFVLRGAGAVRSRLDALQARGALSPFVGRTHEFAILGAALDRTLAGHGQSVALVGEPGIGKSRIVREIAARCAEAGVATLATRAVAHGRETALLPVLELLRSAMDVRDDDDPAVAREQVAGALPAEFAPDLLLLWDFLGITDPENPAPMIDPEARERRLVELVGRIVHARGHREPLLLIVEDLHWLDDASALFAAELIRTVPGTKVLMLVTYRPEYRGATPGETIVLGPLRQAAIDTVLAGTLGHHPSVRDLSRRIAARAAGNPFFCEELVQGLVDSGRLAGPRGDRRLLDDLNQIALPATVQATLAARIDRLEEGQKEVLLVASVIGEAADRGLLAHVHGTEGVALEDVLAALVASDLLEETAEDKIAFRHPLIQEVAYRGQLLERRRRTHSRTADALIELHADRLDERAALIAHHAEQAGRLADAAGWHARAATWTGVTSASEALRHWLAAKRIADALPPGPDRDGLAIGARLGVLSQSWRLKIADTVADDARAQTVAMLDPEQIDGPMRVLIDYAYAANLGFGGRVAEGLWIARVNTRRAAALDDPDLIVLAAGAHWYMALTCGRVEEGRRVSDIALQRAGDDTRLGTILSGAIDHPYALCLYGRGYCNGFLGNVRAGMTDIRRAIVLAQEEGAGEVEPYALSGLCFLQSMVGEGDGAQADAERALEVARRRGNGMALMAAWLGHVWAGLAVRDHRTVHRAALEMFDAGAERGIGVELLTFAHGALSEVALAAGDAERAVLEARRSIEAATMPAPTWGELLGRLRLAHALLGRDGAAALAPAAQEIDRAAELATEYGITICDPRIHSARVALSRAGGDHVAEGRFTLAEQNAVRALAPPPPSS